MDLIAYLPWRIYHDQKYVLDLQQATDKELKALQVARDDLYLQMRPSTADWGLGIFEEEYDLPTKDDKSLEQRLARWRAKRRGRSTTKTPVIKKVAEDLTGLEAIVLEFPEEDRFEIWLLQSGAPPVTDDLIDTIEEIKPAHLGVAYGHRSSAHTKVYAAAQAYSRTQLHTGLPTQPAINITPRLYIAAAVPIYYRQTAGGVINYG